VPLVPDNQLVSASGWSSLFCFLFVYHSAKRAKLQIKRGKNPSDLKKLAVCLGGYDILLEEEQCYLNRCGMVHLIIKLIKTSPSHNVFLKVIELAVAMLNGGNADVQVSCLGERK